MDNLIFDCEDKEILIGDIIMLEHCIGAEKTKTYYLYKMNGMDKGLFYKYSQIGVISLDKLGNFPMDKSAKLSKSEINHWYKIGAENEVFSTIDFSCQNSG